VRWSHAKNGNAEDSHRGSRHTQQMPEWTRLVLLVCWVAVGWLIGRRSGRAGTGILWAVVLGPLGLILFAYGERRRSETQPPRGGLKAADARLNIPVEVLTDGSWLKGRLQTWAQYAEEWHGWVEYNLDGVDQAAWFGPEQLRKSTAS
jgi:hypothetical protein